MVINLLAMVIVFIMLLFLYIQGYAFNFIISVVAYISLCLYEKNNNWINLYNLIFEKWYNKWYNIETINDTINDTIKNDLPDVENQIYKFILRNGRLNNVKVAMDEFNKKSWI